MYIENGKIFLENITIDQMFILDNICTEQYMSKYCNNEKLLLICQEYLDSIHTDPLLESLTEHDHAWFLSLRNNLIDKVEFTVNADHVVYFADSFIILHDDLLQKDIEKRKKRQRVKREKARLKAVSQ